MAELKARPGGELQVHGSARLGAWLLAQGLVDELRLMVAPVVVGEERRFFRPGHNLLRCARPVRRRRSVCSVNLAGREEPDLKVSHAHRAW
ncbi:MAG: hypothetical protein ABT15_16840 [Pseudonocardia sp. SCN 73-27]|uniref:dihydrofolate reductase family protein n=1 Tax=unclassified Pseudonocardia TaxID=2619320 RepID=UPI000868DD43|nr:MULTISPECIES: dihydrofolate reductase family protein [Actinomycetes]ODU24781.1 MAG: hypothetical protein ABS80_11440 [Pseudonocardia sp. SCN 72-51]ODV05530.1 MAG: hypothetical protein ABT15_16840 [Pseudonocardia sp. SCN 73-27]